MFSADDKKAIAQSVKNAEQNTKAELVCVVTPASDVYHSYLFLYGFITGSIVAMVLWLSNTTNFFPILLTIQMACVALLPFISPLRRLCVALVPARVKHHRAAHRAFAEFLFAQRHLSSDTPVVLLYVSIAEHYAHILRSRAVHEKTPDAKWDEVIHTLTSSARSGNIKDATIAAIEQASILLSANFPKV